LLLAGLWAECSLLSTSRPSGGCRARGQRERDQTGDSAAAPAGVDHLPRAPRLSAIALRWLSGSGLKSCPQGQQLQYRSYSPSARCTTAVLAAGPPRRRWAADIAARGGHRADRHRGPRRAGPIAASDTAVAVGRTRRCARGLAGVRRRRIFGDPGSPQLAAAAGSRRRAQGGQHLPIPDAAIAILPSWEQRSAEHDQAQGCDPRGDLRWGVADRVVEDEDPAEQRDDVAGQRGEEDDRDRGPDLEASREASRYVLRSGDEVSSSVAPSFAGEHDARSGPGRRSLEVFTSSCRCGVCNVVERVVVVELALRLVRNQTENADVRVGHDRAPGSGNLIATAVA
jgi:hypothetical protein